VILSSELRTTIDEYANLFGFKPEFLGAQRVVIRNPHFKIIFLGQRYSIDVLLSDTSEKNQVDLPSLVRFLFPHVTLDYRSESNFDSLIKTHLADVLMTGDLNWEEVMNFLRK
jgi:hypothetical protein